MLPYSLCLLWLLGLILAAIPAPLLGQIVINEVLADPPPGTAGDANNDGSTHAFQDEFIELLNLGSEAVDIGNWTLSDDDVSAASRFRFPVATTIGAESFIVLFGGGSPQGIPGQVFTDDGRIGNGLSNSGDRVELRNSADSLIASFTYATEGGDNQSLTRDPDGTGAFVKHSTAQGAGGNLFSPGTTLFGDTSLPVELSSFTASASDGQVELVWVTESETNNLGFHLYRAEDESAEPTRITRQIISGAGNSTTRHQYRFTDRTVYNGHTYFYWLEDIDFQGHSQRHGPVRAMPVVPTYTNVTAFTGTSTAQGIKLTWVTTTEDNLAHFNIYRREQADARRRLVAPQIQPQGSTNQQTTYAWIDRAVVVGWRYWYELESVAQDSRTILHSQITLRLRQDPSIPIHFRLDPNYPNPFNPTTRIPFAVPGVGGLDPGYGTAVRLTVYNLLGQEIIRLVDEQRRPGFYEELWDGHDKNGYPLAGGIYLYHLQVGRFSASRKMTLLR